METSASNPNGTVVPLAMRGGCSAERDISGFLELLIGRGGGMSVVHSEADVS
jgi:hypothetical protein